MHFSRSSLGAACAALWVVGVCAQADQGTFEMLMRIVPEGGVGPAYTFSMGQYEVTNEQFAAFLNDAERNPDNERGAFLKFADSGDVGLLDVYDPDAVYSVSANCDESDGGACPIIKYNPSEDPGERYVCEPGYEQHPAVGVTYYGALKFCNWLTLDQGLEPSQRCYAEGPAEADWHPVTIDTANWGARDLNDDERAALVDGYSGFRLPMDNVGWTPGPIGQQENAFNEYYKAAVYDREAPDEIRYGPGGEPVSPDHWLYAFGRDSILDEDANYRNSKDPYEPGRTPAGFYNGENRLDDGETFSRDTNNPYGLYDMSGNALEWVQDQCFAAQFRTLRGGADDDSSGGLGASNRTLERPRTASPHIGFRVVQVLGCATDVRKTWARVSDDQPGRVNVAVRLGGVEGGKPEGWLVTIKTTRVENGRVKESTLKPTNGNGKAKGTLNLRSGNYILEVIGVQTPFGRDCFPANCRHCLTVFQVP